MWARHLELMLGLWLAVTPFVLRYPPEPAGPWLRELGTALAIAVAALLAHWRPLRQIHLLLLPVAAWLVAAGWWASAGSADAPAADQNRILVGLLLLMLAVIPSDATRPPEGWQALVRARGGASQSR